MRDSIEILQNSNKRFKTAKKHRKFSERFDIQFKSYKTQIKGSKQQKNVGNSVKGLTFNSKPTKLQ